MKRTMRPAIMLLCVCMLLCGCGKDNILSRTNVYGIFALEYEYFNSEDTCQFELKNGEVLHFAVETKDGSVEIKVVDIVILTGHKAEGGIDITVDSAQAK